MIASISGRLTRKSPTEACIEVHGVTFAISIPISTFEVLGEVESTTSLHTLLIVREDALQLYGFATHGEKEMFRLLTSVSGIGPKMAQMILSGTRVEDLKVHLSSGNLGALTVIPGIGKKLGERLVVELRDKVGRLQLTQSPGGAITSTQTQTQSEAILALTSLGYTRSAAEKAVRSVSDGRLQSLEDLIKSALRITSK